MLISAGAFELFIGRTQNAGIFSITHIWDGYEVTVFKWMIIYSRRQKHHESQRKESNRKAPKPNQDD